MSKYVNKIYVVGYIANEKCYIPQVVHIQPFSPHIIAKHKNNRFIYLSNDSDLTQNQIAEYLGTSQTMYARYERGANEMPVRHLIRLAKYYGVSMDYLCGLSDHKHNTPPASFRKK